MAAERSTRIETYLSQLPRDRSSTIKAVEMLTVIQAEIFDQFMRGLIPKSQALNELVKHSMRLDTFVNDISMEYTANVANSRGYDTLTNDMSGAQSVDWFESTQRPFSTGYVSSGLGVVIIHPDIGMAAVNSNTVTENDMREAFLGALNDPRTMLTDDPEPLSLVSPYSLQRTTDKAIKTAFDQFSSISPDGIPQKGTMIILFGVDYARDKEINAIQSAALNSIKKNPLMHDGKFLGQNRHINFNIDGLGQAGELIYGGKNHPQYGRVNIYGR